MAKYNQLVIKAECLRQRIDETLQPLEDALSTLLEQDVGVLYQTGDGWVVCWDGGMNSIVDFDMLLKMDKEEAFNYLERTSI